MTYNNIEMQVTAMVGENIEMQVTAIIGDSNDRSKY